MERRQAIAVLVTVCTGGCLRLTDVQGEGGESSGDQQDDGDATGTPATEQGEGGATGTPEQGNGVGTDDGDEPSGEVSGTTDASYQFSEGESYTYSFTGGSSFTFEWEVTDVEGNEFTAELSGPEQGERVVGTMDTILQTLQDSDTSVASVFAALRFGPALAAGQSLRVGNSWTVTADEFSEIASEADWETLTMEVTGTDSYSGVQCSNVRITSDTEEDPTVLCLNSEFPFSIATLDPEQDSARIELSSFDR